MSPHPRREPQFLFSLRPCRSAPEPTDKGPCLRKPKFTHQTWQPPRQQAPTQDAALSLLSQPHPPASGWDCSFPHRSAMHTHQAQRRVDTGHPLGARALLHQNKGEMGHGHLKRHQCCCFVSNRVLDQIKEMVILVQSVHDHASAKNEVWFHGCKGGREEEEGKDANEAERAMKPEQCKLQQASHEEAPHQLGKWTG